MKYIVNVHYTMIHQMEVEADSPEQAEELAAEKFSEESQDWSRDDFDSVTDTCVVDTL